MRKHKIGVEFTLRVAIFSRASTRSSAIVCWSLWAYEDTLDPPLYPERWTENPGTNTDNGREVVLNAWVLN